MQGPRSSQMGQRAGGRDPGRQASSAQAGGVRTPDGEIPGRHTLLLCLALMAVVFACYSRVVRNQFIPYDDDKYITENPHVKAGLTWQTVKWAFTAYDESNWHPLTWLSHALDVSLFGLKPAGHHVVNVLLHALNAVLLFLLLQYATGFRWRSLMVAALFALHPVNVESVAWAAERKNVLSMMFFLLALYAYEWYARGPERRRYAAVVACFALGLMAKPQVITFPFLLLLWDYWPLGRIAGRDQAASATGRDFPRVPIGRLLWEKAPLLLLSAASAVVTMSAQTAGRAVKPLSQYSRLLRLENALISYVRYLGMALWPSKLVVMYPHPTKLYPAWQVGGAVLLLIVITAVVLRARQRRYLAVGWCWFLGSLVPMIGLVQAGDQALADRYAYIPFIGLFVMMVWLVAEWAGPVTAEWGGRTLRLRSGQAASAARYESWGQARQISARWLAVAAIACLVALGISTYRQVGYWHDTESFWRRTLALTQDNFVAEGALGAFLRSHGRTEEAVAHYRAAIAIRPDDFPAVLNLGAYEHSHGNLEAAIERYEFVALHAASESLRAKAYANMGFAYRQMGQLAKAKESFDLSLQLMPNQPGTMVERGLIAQTEGDLPTAVRQYSGAMRLQPTDVGYVLLSLALRQQGNASQADEVLRRAASISANLPEAEKRAEALLARK
jgi:protein O-mannosyl-transferase